MDQFLIRKYFNDHPALAIYAGALVYLLAIPFIALIFWADVKTETNTAYLLILFGFASLFIWIPYFKALDQIDSSVAMPLLQTNPIIVYILAFLFLQERVSLEMLGASLLIVMGAILVSLHLGQGSQIKIKPILNILACAFLVACQTLLMKVFVGQDISIFVMAFWCAVGFASASILRLALNHRLIAVLIEKLKHSKGQIFILSCSQEASYFLSLILSFYALKLAPASGMVAAVMSIHAFYVLILVVFLSRIFPNYFDDLSGKTAGSRRLIFQRFSAILMIMGGIVWLSFFPV
jgi:transporter family protein